MPFSTALYKCYVDEEICDQIIEWINAKSGTDHMAAFNLVGQISGEYVIDIGTFPKLETAIKSNMATYIMSLIDLLRFSENDFISVTSVTQTESFTIGERIPI
jgi:hypothetical protein